MSNYLILYAFCIATLCNLLMVARTSALTFNIQHSPKSKTLVAQYHPNFITFENICLNLWCNISSIVADFCVELIFENPVYRFVVKRICNIVAFFYISTRFKYGTDIWICLGYWWLFFLLIRSILSWENGFKTMLMLKLLHRPELFMEVHSSSMSLDSLHKQPPSRCVWL